MNFGHRRFTKQDAIESLLEDKQTARTLVAAEILTGGKQRDQRFAAKMNLIKSTFNDVFDPHAGRMATRKRSYYNRYNNETQIQVLQSNMASTGRGTKTSFSVQPTLHGLRQQHADDSAMREIVTQEAVIREKLSVLEGLVEEANASPLSPKNRGKTDRLPNHEGSHLSHVVPKPKLSQITSPLKVGRHPTVQETSGQITKPKLMIQSPVKGVSPARHLTTKHAQHMSKMSSGLVGFGHDATPDDSSVGIDRRELVKKQKEFNEQVRNQLQERIRSRQASMDSVLRSEAKRGLEKSKLDADLARTRQHNHMTSEILRNAREQSRVQRGSDLQLDRSLVSEDLAGEVGYTGALRVEEQASAKSVRGGPKKVSNLIFANINQEVKRKQADSKFRFASSMNVVDQIPGAGDGSIQLCREVEEAAATALTGEQSPPQGSQTMTGTQTGFKHSTTLGQGFKRRSRRKVGFVENLKAKHAAGELASQIPIFTERARIQKEERVQKELADKLKDRVMEKLVAKQQEETVADEYERLQVTLRKSLRLSGQRSHVRGFRVTQQMNIMDEQGVNTMRDTHNSFARMYPDFKVGLDESHSSNSDIEEEKESEADGTWSRTVASPAKKREGDPSNNSPSRVSGSPIKESEAKRRLSRRMSKLIEQAEASLSPQRIKEKIGQALLAKMAGLGQSPGGLKSPLGGMLSALAKPKDASPLSFAGQGQKVFKLEKHGMDTFQTQQTSSSHESPRKKVAAIDPKALKKRDVRQAADRQQMFRGLMTVLDKGLVEGFDAKVSDMLLEGARTDEESEDDTKEFPFARQGSGKLLKVYKKSGEEPDDDKAPGVGSATEQMLLAMSQEATLRNTFVSDGGKTAYKVAVPPLHAEPEIKAEELRGLGDFRAARADAFMKDDARKVQIMKQFYEYLQAEFVKDNIELALNKLSDKVLDEGFQKFMEIEDKGLKQFAEAVQNKRDFFGICKHAHSPRSVEGLRDEPRYVFFKECYRQFLPVISLLQKVEGKALSLTGYFIGENHCKAFNLACKFFPDSLTQIVLNNNGLKDPGLSLILSGLGHLTGVKKIVIIDNEFGPESLWSFRQLVNKENTKLEELRLCNCRLQPQTTVDVLTDLRTYHFGTLRKLSLVAASLNKESMKKILDFVKNSKVLMDLDISYNELTFLEMGELISALPANKRLQYLNLSWNSIGPGTKTDAEPVDPKAKEAWVAAKEEQKQLEDETMEELGTFMKHNSKLLHLNLSQTNLSRRMLEMIGPILRKARSMLALHLSGNPGVGQGLKDALHTRAHCAPPVEHVHFELLDRTKIGKGLRSEGPSLLKSGLKLRRFMHDKARRQDGQLPEFGFQDNKLVFQRVIGHKPDVPGAGQWKMLTKPNEKCWICNNDVFSIILWSRQIGVLGRNQVDIRGDELLEQNVERLQEKMVKEEQIRKENGEEAPTADSSYDTQLGTVGSSPGEPVIMGPFSNWHPKKMIPIERFCLNIDRNKPDFIRKMIVEGLCRRTATTYDQLNDEERINLRQIELEYSAGYRRHWDEVIARNLPERTINYVNTTLFKKSLPMKPDVNVNEIPPKASTEELPVETYTEQASLTSEGVTEDNKPCDDDSLLGSDFNWNESQRLYVFPCFLKPGNQKYLVRLDQNPDNFPHARLTDAPLPPEYFSHATMAPIRTIDLPNQVKTYNTVTEERKFDKNASVFKDWRENTDERLAACCEHDFAFWKLDRFVKNEEEREEILKIIRKHMGTLKTLHTYYAASSINPGYPSMSELEYSSFLKKLKLTDKDLFKGIEFKGTMQRGVEGVLDNQLMRFQFVEVVVRLALVMNKTAGANLTESEAVRTFIEQEVVSKTQDIVDEWQGWRERQLWTIEANEMMKANYIGIKTLVEAYHRPMQKFMDKDSAVKVFSGDTDLLLEKDAAYCYGMAKMLNSNDTKNAAKYKQIENLTEFMEMIARVAELKARNDPELRNQSIGEKIFFILEKILPIVGVQPQVPDGDEANEQSQSDEDY